MPATSREINVARLEHILNEEWEELVDLICSDKRNLDRLMREFNCLTTTPILSRLIIWKCPAMMRLVVIGMKRLTEEAVRRGILPEQKIKEIEP